MKKIALFAISSIYLGVSLIASNVAVAQSTSRTFTKSSPAMKNALVELFTSDGCDSCPPANKWLSGVLKKGSPTLIPVSMHVTYWNNLGWVDPVSDKYFDEKQRHYTQLGLAKFAYTPALFLSGAEWSGWRSNDERNVSLVTQQPAAIGIALSAELGDAKTVKVQVQLTATPYGTAANLSQARQFVYLYEDALIDTPRAGELKGVTLRHDHVVKKWDERRINGLPSNSTVELAIPEGANRNNLGLVAFVQSQDGREIFQVIDLPLHGGL